MARPQRMLAWMAGAALAAYVALCALLYLQQRRLIYYPQFTRVEAAQTDFALARQEVVLRGWAVNPGRRDAVVCGPCGLRGVCVRWRGWRRG